MAVVKLYMMRLKDYLKGNPDIAPKEAHERLVREGIDVSYDSVRKWLKRNRPILNDKVDAIINENVDEPFNINDYIVEGLVSREEQYRKKLDQEELRLLRLEVLNYRKKDYVLERVARLVENTIHALPAPKYIPSTSQESRDNPKMVEIPIVDLHYGKLGVSNDPNGLYDHSLAEERFSSIISSAMDKIKGINVTEIVFPIGSDFFNFDNLKGATTRGTQQDNDLKLFDMFDKGVELLVNAIHLISTSNAKLKVLYVPGNHDYTISYYCTKVLEAHFRNYKNIEFDVSPSPRKYVRFGNSMVLFTHGKDEKPKELAEIAAAERPEMWGETLYREAHIGHLHSESVTNHKGFIVRRLPSVTGEDEWLHNQGYVGTQIVSQIFIHDAQQGLESIRYIRCDK